MSARERFFKKVQQSIGDKPIYVNTAEAEVRAFFSQYRQSGRLVLIAGDIHRANAHP